MRRANRLRSADGFSLAYRTGVRTRSPSVVAIGARSDDGEPKVAVTCSRRIGGAVLRNRAKRRLRAAADAYVGRMVPGALVVLQATERTTQVDFQKLVDDVGEGLERVGVLAS